jgi:hypothetical protein
MYYCEHEPFCTNADEHFVNVMMVADIEEFLREERAGLHGGDAPLTQEERDFVSGQQGEQ